MSSSEVSSSSTSVSLIRRLRQFDEEAWNRLSRLYNPVIYHWCRRAGLQDSDAADVVQEVFRAVASGIESFASESDSGTFRGWLWGITRNKLADHHRKAVRHPGPIGGTDGHERTLEMIGTSNESHDGTADFDADAAVLHRALEIIRAEFEQQTWEAFFQMVIGGRPAAEIGETLGMSKKAIRQAKYRVLRRLRIELDQQLN